MGQLLKNGVPCRARLRNEPGGGVDADAFPPSTVLVVVVESVDAGIEREVPEQRRKKGGEAIFVAFIKVDAIFIRGASTFPL